MPIGWLAPPSTATEYPLGKLEPVVLVVTSRLPVGCATVFTMSPLVRVPWRLYDRVGNVIRKKSESLSAEPRSHATSVNGSSAPFSRRPTPSTSAPAVGSLHCADELRNAVID